MRVTAKAQPQLTGLEMGPRLRAEPLARIGETVRDAVAAVVAAEPPIQRR